MKFRFETLLRLRKNKEQAEQREMARMQQHLYARQKELQDLKTSGDTHQSQLQARLTETLDSGTLGLYDRYLQSLGNRTQRYNQVISESSEQVENKRQELITAMKKRRALEILKDRELLTKKRKTLKDEIAFTDEIASVRWQRRDA